METLGARSISINLDKMRTDYRIRIKHDGTEMRLNRATGPYALIEYRLKQLGGKIRTRRISPSLQYTEFTIPGDGQDWTGGFDS